MEAGGLFSLRNKSLTGIKRIKISRACDECRKRKVKCDGVQPCGRCRKSNAECVFAKLPPKRGPPKQYMENLENRLQRVEKALKSMTAPVKKVFEDALASEKRKQLLELNNIPEVPCCQSSQSQQQHSVSCSAPYTSELSQQQIDRFTINEIGQAVYVNDLKVRIDRIPNEQQQQSNSNNNDTHSDISDSPISSSTASFFNHSVPTIITTPVSVAISAENSMPDGLSSRLLISEVQPLTEVYFDHVHKYVPMIHKPTFLKQMHNPTNPPSRFLLYTMCAVATRWAPEPLLSSFNKTIPPGYTYYQRALEIMDDFIDVPRISTVQALLLIVKYQECYQRSGYFHRSHFYLSMAVRMCQDLGLSQLDCDAHDAETKRRTFWITFMYDLLMSIEQKRSTFFKVHECKTGFPLVTGEEGPALEELITNQNIFIQLGKVLSDIHVMAQRITARQKKQGDQRSTEQTVEEQARLFSLHTHLENFLYEVPPTLVYPPTQDTESYPAEKQVIGDPFIGYLHMTYHFSVILLHRLYLSLPPPTTEHNFVSYPHRRLCASSASNITMIAETMFERYPTWVFHYPIRGIQHTMHCLAAAATIHKYEMTHGEDDLVRDFANRQYMTSLSIMQHLSYETPSVELGQYFNDSIQVPIPPTPPQPQTVAEKRMSAPIQPMMMYSNNDVPTSNNERSRVRRNTFSSSAMDETALYQSSASIHSSNSSSGDGGGSSNPMAQHFMTSYVTPHSNTSPFTQPMQPWQPLEEEMQPPQHHHGDPSYHRRSYHVPSTHQLQQQQQQWNSPLYYQPSYSDQQQQQQQFDMLLPSTTTTPTTNSNGGGRVRRHTVSNPSQQQHYYPVNDLVLQEEDFKKDQQQQQHQAQAHYQPQYDPNHLNMDMMNHTEDTIMMDTTPAQHYDPITGMSQLFLTDNQQQQLAWNGSMLSTNTTRSEGHVMK